MNINKTSELFTLNNFYKNFICEDSKVKFSRSNALLDNFSNIYKKEFDKLPYRLNLLDDLATNENAHSKFLIRLLQYQPTLINFLIFINNNNKHSFSFDIEIVKKPVLTYEKMRIDGLIRENKKYAVIIENKIHNAKEQQHQIGRYIDKCKGIGFKTEQIFVLYLTKTEADNHSEQTWGDEYTPAEFRTRYSKLSYESDILPWLENYCEVLQPKEQLIKSAVVQYIDHLKHFFNKKEIYSNMNTELQNFLSEQLNLTTDNIENIEIVAAKIHEINELKKQLDDLERTSKKKLFLEWQNNLKEKFGFDEKQLFYQDKDSFIKTGVKLEYNGKFFSVLIEHDFNTTYFGFGRHFASDALDQETREFLETIIIKEAMEKTHWWYGWKYTTFTDGYFNLEYILNMVLEKFDSLK